MPDRPQLTPELLDADACAAMSGLSRRTWLKLASTGEAPRPVELPVLRMTRWRRADVLAWIAELPSRSRE